MRKTKQEGRLVAKAAWTGDRPMAALGKELWAYSTQGRNLLHDVGSNEVIHLSVVFSF